MNTPADSAMNVAALVQLLEHQRVLYRRLRLLADRQRALVMAEDSAALILLLSERQTLVDGLVHLTSQMAPYRSRWTQLFQGMDDSARMQVTALLEEVNGSLSAILASDSRDTTTLKARRDSAAQQLSSIGEGSRASAAYADQAPARGLGEYAEVQA
ncbi:MAG TPA: hypothetical protein VMV81_07965 [Phycisphaerae bacterium]|nr:hypothetical protein [Phycisphaerae bacterium]